MNMWQDFTQDENDDNDDDVSDCCSITCIPSGESDGESDDDENDDVVFDDDEKHYNNGFPVSQPQNDKTFSVSGDTWHSSFNATNVFDVPFEPDGEFDEIDPKIERVMNTLRDTIREFQKEERETSQRSVVATSLVPCRGVGTSKRETPPSVGANMIETGGITKKNLLNSRAKSVTSACSIHVVDDEDTRIVEDTLASSASACRVPSQATSLGSFKLRSFKPMDWKAPELSFVYAYMKRKLLRFYRHPKKMFCALQQLARRLTNGEPFVQFMSSVMQMERSTTYVICKLNATVHTHTHTCTNRWHTWSGNQRHTLANGLSINHIHLCVWLWEPRVFLFGCTRSAKFKLPVVNETTERLFLFVLRPLMLQSGVSRLELCPFNTVVTERLKILGTPLAFVNKAITSTKTGLISWLQSSGVSSQGSSYLLEMAKLRFRYPDFDSNDTKTCLDAGASHYKSKRKNRWTYIEDYCLLRNLRTYGRNVTEFENLDLLSKRTAAAMGNRYDQQLRRAKEMFGDEIVRATIRVRKEKGLWIKGSHGPKKKKRKKKKDGVS